MKVKELYADKARLESRLDMIESEITGLNALLRQCGFPKGIAELRSALLSILTEETDE